jgi:enamine deaminase RidA (YjgF/YER057c/UK114 family)
MGEAHVPSRRSIDIESFAHSNPLPSASRIGPLVMSSVVVGRDPGGTTVPDEVSGQLANLFHHVGELLTAAGATWDDVVKMNFWVPSLDDRALLNEPWLAHFPDEASRPARHTQVGGPIATCDFTAYVVGD